MKIDFNPNAAAHAPNARGPQAQSTPTPPAPAGSGGGVEITLSPAAQQALKAGASEYTGTSPAHMARQYIAQSLDIAQSLAGAAAEGADGPDLSGPFGQIVKTFAPGHNKGTADVGDAVPEDGGDTAGVTDPADGTDTPPADGSDGTNVVEGSDGTDGTGTPPADVTEVLGESAPAEGEVTEPESGIAGSGDAVASSGDDAPVDEGTTVDSGAPVTVVDTGDVTDELFDLLDEGSEEIV